MLETCAMCGKEVGYRHTVHVVLNPGGDEGVHDHYVCRSCYDADLAPLFAGGTDADAADERDAGEGDADERDADGRDPDERAPGEVGAGGGADDVDAADEPAEAA